MMDGRIITIARRTKANNIRRRRALCENSIGVLTTLTVFGLAVAAHDKGIQQKWITALLGTVFPFALVIYLRRRGLRWSFWASLAIFFAVHCIVIGFVFGYLLANFQSFSPLLWCPVMLVEVFVLIIGVKRIEERLTGKREVVRLKF